MCPVIDRTFKIDEPLLSDQIKIEYAKQTANKLSGELVSQGWIGYAGTHVPMFVHKLGLIKPRQT